MGLAPYRDRQLDGKPAECRMTDHWYRLGGRCNLALHVGGELSQIRYGAV